MQAGGDGKGREAEAGICPRCRAAAGWGEGKWGRCRQAS